MTRSAVQLAARPTGAPGLIEAHLGQVDRELATLSPRRVVPISQLREPRTVVGALVVGIVVVALLGSDRAGSGAFALLHPEARDDGGTRIARVVAEAQAEVRFPAYMSRDPITITSPRIEAPRGATIVWRMRPRIEIADEREHRAPLQHHRVVADFAGDGAAARRELPRHQARLAEPGQNGQQDKDGSSGCHRAGPR